MNERKDKYICTYTEKKTEKQNKYISIYKNSEKIEFSWCGDHLREKDLFMFF